MSSGTTPQLLLFLLFFLFSFSRSRHKLRSSLTPLLDNMLHVPHLRMSSALSSGRTPRYTTQRQTANDREEMQTVSNVTVTYNIEDLVANVFNRWCISNVGHLWVLLQKEQQEIRKGKDQKARGEERKIAGTLEKTGGYSSDSPRVARQGKYSCTRHSCICSSSTACRPRNYSNIQ